MVGFSVSSGVVWGLVVPDVVSRLYLVCKVLRGRLGRGLG